MIPRYDIIVDPQIPEGASFWVPTAEELEENEGHIGDFHDSEFIETDVNEARQVVEAERVAVAFADANSTTPEEFEEIAAQTEFEFADVPSDEAPSFMIEQSWYGVGNLELGVAGLTYALNAVGIITGASCRSHAVGHRPWSDHPVVIFAANEQQIEQLQPLVQAAGCGFEVDDVNRSQLIAIAAASIVEMMALAEQVLEHADLLIPAGA